MANNGTRIFQSRLARELQQSKDILPGIHLVSCLRSPELSLTPQIPFWAYS